MKPFSARLWLAIAVCCAVALACDPVLAQAARNPFSVGAEQGGGNATGLMGWILAQQNQFYLALKSAVRDASHNGAAAWTLAGLSFAYGVFHAAGPGHGKAVVASYMLANEQALRRGLVISLLAALLQGFVAVAIVSLAALVFNATAARINDAAALVEELSYLGIIMLGFWLIWRKGAALLAALRPAPAVPGQDHSGQDHSAHDHSGHDQSGHDHSGHDHSHGHDAHCGHFHAADPKTLNAGFSWRAALTTVAVAGSRPCSGAILVLVFTLAQGIFWVGIWSTLAMSLGTAITTGALAAMAVLAKGVALRFAGPDSGRGRMIGPGLELAAAVVVLLAGTALLMGATAHPAG